MESRALRILGLGILGLIAVFLVTSALAYAFLAGALIPLMFLVLGQFYLPHSRRGLTVWFNPFAVLDDKGEVVQAEPGEVVGRLSGKVLGYSYFKQWHEFRIVTHRFWLLGLVGALSLAAAWLVLWLKDKLLDDIGILYLGEFFWLFIVFLAWRWFWERRMLRREGLALGTFSVYAVSHPHRLHIRYHFVDHGEQYRGGIVDSFVCDMADTMTIVFYDEADPERSFPASALMFHKLAWNEQQPATAAASV